MSTPSSSFDSVRSPLPLAVAYADYAQSSKASTRFFARQQVATSETATTTTASTPSQDGFPANSPSSVPTSPEVLDGLTHQEPDGLAPLTLPKSPLSSLPTSPPNAMADAFAMTGATGLIRKLSRGAHQRLRRRTSNTNVRGRDQSSGPMRRRGDSKALGDGSYEISDLDLDDEDSHTDALVLHKLDTDILRPRPPPRKLSRRSSGKSSIPTLPPPPAEGTTFVKITRKKRKTIKFWLDVASAKVSWAPNPPNAKKQLYVDDIKELRTGDMARNYLEEFSVALENLPRWITIIYDDPLTLKGRPTKCMHLIAPDEQSRDQWVSYLLHLMKSRGDAMAAMAENNEAQWRGHWKLEMDKKFANELRDADDEMMNFADILKTCRGFSINKSEKDLKLQFEEVDESNSGSLNLQQYLDFFKRLTERRDIRHIFECFKSPNEQSLSWEEFQKFLHHQGEHLDTDRTHWEWIFEKFATRRARDTPTMQSLRRDSDPTLGMYFEAFQGFLLSDYNSALVKQRNPPFLDRPLNEYFISSSHNTYLTGRQVGGQSSSEAYVEALKKGCRCVEIDTKDGDDGRPVVTHVNSWTSRATFSDCIKAINQYAFYSSPYPLIISLEVHCGPEQQKTMVDIIKEHFGNQLLLEPLRANSTILPSPEELKGRILIKVKEPRRGDTPATQTQPQLPIPSAPVHRRQRSVSAPDPRVIQGQLPTLSTIGSKPSPVGAAARFNTYTTNPPNALAGPNPSSLPGTSSDDSDFEAIEPSSPRKSKSKTSNITKVLGDLGVYTRGISFSDWAAPESKTYNHIFSFNETTFENKCKTADTKALLEKHNEKCLMRVYPKGSRVNSSNFDPLQFWRRGVQMVATNWQTHDLGTQVNDAMFAAAWDQTGYVLKPEEVRKFKDLDVNEKGPRLKRVKVEFTVDIISAHYLETPSDLRPGAEMNPYVEFEMYSAEDKAKGIAISEGGTDASARNGVSGIGSPVRKRTPIVEGNGYNPVFNEPMRMSLETKYPSLVFVRWTVWNSPDGRSISGNKQPISSFTAKLSSLQQGFRHLELVDRHGETVHSKLFVRIQKQDHRDVFIEPRSDNGDSSFDLVRTSEESSRSSKYFLRRVLGRNSSERKKSKDRDGRPFARANTIEK